MLWACQESLSIQKGSSREGEGEARDTQAHIGRDSGRDSRQAHVRLGHQYSGNKEACQRWHPDAWERGHSITFLTATCHSEHCADQDYCQWEKRSGWVVKEANRGAKEGERRAERSKRVTQGRAREDKKDLLGTRGQIGRVYRCSTICLKSDQWCHYWHRRQRLGCKSQRVPARQQRRFRCEGSNSCELQKLAHTMGQSHTRPGLAHHLSHDKEVPQHEVHKP